jgi:cobalt/nickel transport system permease protein
LNTKDSLKEVRVSKSLFYISKLTKGVKSNMKMSMREKKMILVSAVFALFFGIVPTSNAMHIMEGYLPPAYCIAWGAICIPFLVAGYLSIQKTLAASRRTITMIAMAGAFIFVLSSLKIPSVTGSCSHMTGTGLGAILLGPAAVSILGLIVLIFQAILLAHGGLTTLGANTFSMAIAGPFVSYGIYLLCKKLGVKKHIGIFLAASIGDLFTYCITSIQLALAYPSENGGIAASMVKFLAVFAPTQLPLAIIEGILTVVIVIGLESYAKSELNDLRSMVGGEN